jgi:hypothetical protein
MHPAFTIVRSAARFPRCANWSHTPSTDCRVPMPNRGAPGSNPAGLSSLRCPGFFLWDNNTETRCRTHRTCPCSAAAPRVVSVTGPCPAFNAAFKRYTLPPWIAAVNIVFAASVRSTVVVATREHPPVIWGHKDPFLRQRCLHVRWRFPLHRNTHTHMSFAHMHAHLSHATQRVVVRVVKMASFSISPLRSCCCVSDRPSHQPYSDRPSHQPYSAGHMLQLSCSYVFGSNTTMLILQDRCHGSLQ